MSELVRDWKAEKKDLEEAFDIISDKLVKADAEIERLKEENSALANSLVEQDFDTDRLKALITKLCDALEKKRREIYDGDAWINTLSEEDEKLLQRAREATR